MANSAEQSLLATALLWRQRAVIYEQVIDHLGNDGIIPSDLLAALEHNRQELRAAREVS